MSDLFVHVGLFSPLVHHLLTTYARQVNKRMGGPFSPPLALLGQTRAETHDCPFFRIAESPDVISARTAHIPQIQLDEPPVAHLMQSYIHLLSIRKNNTFVRPQQMLDFVQIHRGIEFSAYFLVLLCPPQAREKQARQPHSMLFAQAF